MNRRKRIRVIQLVLGTALSVAPNNASLAAGQIRPDSTQNGHWWLSLPTRERDGFVAGFVDCYSFSHRSGTFGKRSLIRYRELTTEVFTKNQMRLGEQVGRIILELRSVPSDEPWLKGGETHPRPHGYFDGMYWMQIGAKEESSPQDADHRIDMRRGFVEGYLHCLAGVRRAPKFSKSAQAYQGLITNWYGLDRGVGDDPYDKRVDTAAADVLMQLCDTCRVHKNR